ncbi:Phenylalanyl-tRNA synthetase beta chain [Sulfurimonas gotlandica GD1]|uniref:Phenylalanine--tRNA ligase beta subunit n=1 Tax=Sulfurimonas gotlandica (strain DSM 19862 / JCM 16533 / GD1) TaxID=929558 RepID=B6BLK8_SULGG|nr:phenylalanine--tRNA ligase subunit beta [Sulfurimonas gotlandica]EDZ61977.1 phenylalanyl-tRNA synthetase, beta subunit [Sulfurimonas gotlandica GD1]EHP28665.1 Phenylalanyl-tRNA synthetase beta chain [Sulfurimonas gotlandica GD1]
MIVTRSWLNEWIDLSGITTEDLAKTFNAIGLEVDRMQSYEIPKKIIVGRVLECEKHPDADKLNVCKVDIGTSIRQIVCGASNVREGLDVVVATIGAVMPDGTVIKPVKLRGVESEGMICSAKEIGLEDCQSGIIELDSSIGKYELGQEVCSLATFSDDLIEIELTANRGDCLSIRGVARDLSAAYDRPVKETNINEDEDRRVGIGRILSLSHENDLDVNLRYRAVDLKDLTLPFIVKLRLAQIEDSRETDIEALMLYVTHSSGVILRAYNYGFFCAENETMAKIELKKDENGYASIMSKEKASTVGIIQEEASKVTYNEGTVLLEASYIPPDIISKKMQESKMESGPMYYRTSRGSEPELNQGLDFCLNLIESNSNSSVFGGTIELCDSYENKIVSVTKNEIDEIIGAKIDKVKITKILRNLGFGTTKSSSENFVISVPRFRHDISHKQDIVEEIVRLVGIDNIPSKPFIFSESSKLEDDYFEYKKRSIYRHKAAQSGFFENVAFVFDEKRVLNEYGFNTTDEKLELLNPIVSTLDTLRPTLMTGLLKAASQNVKNGVTSVKLFEVGSVFSPLREESLKMSFIFSGDTQKENLANAGKPQKVDFAFFTQKISDVIGEFELRQYETLHSLSHIYQSAELLQNGEVMGELFRVHPNVEDSYGLEATYICELDFVKLSYGLKIAKKSSKYQAAFRDLSIIMPEAMSYEKVKNVIEAHSSEELIRFYPVDKYSDESLGENMSLSIRFVLQSFDKTLEEEDITSSMDSILAALNSELGIGLR